MLFLYTASLQKLLKLKDSQSDLGYFPPKIIMAAAAALEEAGQWRGEGSLELSVS